MNVRMKEVRAEWELQVSAEGAPTETLPPIAFDRRLEPDAGSGDVVGYVRRAVSHRGASSHSTQTRGSHRYIVKMRRSSRTGN